VWSQQNADQHSCICPIYAPSPSVSDAGRALTHLLSSLTAHSHRSIGGHQELATVIFNLLVSLSSTYPRSAFLATAGHRVPFNSLFAMNYWSLQYHSAAFVYTEVMVLYTSLHTLLVRTWLYELMKVYAKTNKVTNNLLWLVLRTYTSFPQRKTNKIINFEHACSLIGIV